MEEHDAGVCSSLTHWMRCLKLKSPVFRFLTCQIRVLQCSKVQILWSSVTCTKHIWQSNYKVLIPPWVIWSTMHWIQCTHCTVLKIHGNWTRINTANRFDPDFWWLVILIVFSVVWNLRYQNLCFLWNSVFFYVLPKFCEFCPVFRIAENWGLYPRLFGLGSGGGGGGGGRNRGRGLTCMKHYIDMCRAFQRKS